MDKAFLVAGLGWGDEGKGTIVDYLAAEWGVTLVVRYNGGPQAGHRVVQPDGREHVFAQLGSGSFHGAETHLGPEMLIEPYALLNEASHLRVTTNVEPLSQLTIHPECALVTPYHWLANRCREAARGGLAHGSCGMGVGECQTDRYEGLDVVAGRMADCLEELRHIKAKKMAELCLLEHRSDRAGLFRAELCALRPESVQQDYRELAPRLNLAFTEDVLKRHEMVAFEGAQGVLLDKTAGLLYPHVTFSSTTFEYAKPYLKDVEECRIGVTRTFMTRHGAGPFVTGDCPVVAYGDHNKFNPWQQAPRAGILDLVALRHSLQVLNGVDFIALTYADLASPFFYCDHYNYGGQRIRYPGEVSPLTVEALNKCSHDARQYDRAGGPVSIIESVLDVDVGIVSYGPTHVQKRALKELFYDR